MVKVITGSLLLLFAGFLSGLSGAQSPESKDSLKALYLESIRLCTDQGKRFPADSRFSSSQNGIIDSVTFTGTSGTKGKCRFLYDEQNRLYRYIISYSFDMQFSDFIRVTNTYNQQSMVVEILHEDVSESVWKPFLMQRLEYSPEGYLSVDLHLMWTEDKWQESSRVSYSQDSAGRDTLMIWEKYLAGNWQNDNSQHEYYSDGPSPDSILFQNWNSENWENSSKTRFSYTDQGYVLSLNSFQFTEGVWKELFRGTWDYAPDWNSATYILQENPDGFWQNDEKKYMLLNRAGYFYYTECEIWTSEGWRRGDLPVVLEDPAIPRIGFIVAELFVYYRKLSSISETETSGDNYLLFHNYPNPFNNETRINYEIKSKSIVTLLIFDELGRLVADLEQGEREKGLYSLKFNSGNLVSGRYFYYLKIKKDSGIFYSAARKMVLLK